MTKYLTQRKQAALQENLNELHDISGTFELVVITSKTGNNEKLFYRYYWWGVGAFKDEENIDYNLLTEEYPSNKQEIAGAFEIYIMQTIILTSPMKQHKTKKPKLTKKVKKIIWQ